MIINDDDDKPNSCSDIPVPNLCKNTTLLYAKPFCMSNDPCNPLQNRLRINNNDEDAPNSHSNVPLPNLHKKT